MRLRELVELILYSIRNNFHIVSDLYKMMWSDDDKLEFHLLFAALYPKETVIHDLWPQVYEVMQLLETHATQLSRVAISGDVLSLLINEPWFNFYVSNEAALLHGNEAYILKHRPVCDSPIFLMNPHLTPKMIQKVRYHFYRGRAFTGKEPVWAVKCMIPLLGKKEIYRMLRQRFVSTQMCSLICDEYKISTYKLPFGEVYNLVLHLHGGEVECITKNTYEQVFDKSVKRGKVHICWNADIHHMYPRASREAIRALFMCRLPIVKCVLYYICQLFSATGPIKII